MAASRKNKRKDKRGRIRPDPPQAGRIRTGIPAPETHLRFSFRYLHPKPPVSQNFPDGYWAELLRCFKQISELRRADLLGNRNPALRAHGIDWAKSNFPNGFEHLPEQYREYAGYQLSVRRDTYGRVIGFIREDVFYVCWLDPNHETMGEQRRTPGEGQCRSI